jgi:hypothetical protein
VSLDAALVGTTSDPRIEAALRQRNDTMHMTGTAWARVVGPVALRAEAALFFGQAYLRDGRGLVQQSLSELTEQDLQVLLATLERDGHVSLTPPPLVVRRDSIEWGIGADYMWGRLLMLAQVNQIAPFESASALLTGDPGTQFTGMLRRGFLREHVEAELRAVYTTGRESWVVFPRVSFVLWRNLRVRAGYLAIGGQSSSLLGQFRENDEFVLQARYTF